MSAEWAARVRAARAYADVNQLPFAKATGLGKKRLQELESGSGEPMTPNELILVAKHSGLPEEFFTIDWEVLTAPIAADELFDRLATIEGQIEFGLSLLQGMVGSDIVNKAEEVVRAARERDQQASEDQSQHSDQA
jgi:transcriptional regulator with XRE-family HTH domain